MNLYLVMVMRRSQFDPAVVPAHQRFLDELRAEGRVERSGPFGDKSGGAYLLRAAGQEEARAIAHRDPTHVSGGWDVTVYEWQAR
ncbi:YciI family protein [Frateuria edaphi]|uniref:YciI family protein n=1 Tax=Frateuria edaphi TaxID=2898793 RepID=UPI001E3BCE3A|nr:YciI family protein [Frateuria edaphi]UGB46710.1 YciI family protein [Frateuria edaphi]